MNNTSINIEDKHPTVSNILEDLYKLKTKVPPVFTSIDDINAFLKINEYGLCDFDSILERIFSNVRICKLHEHTPVNNDILKQIEDFILNISDNLVTMRNYPHKYFDVLIDQQKTLYSTKWEKPEYLDEIDKLQKKSLELYKTNIIIYTVNKIRTIIIKNINYIEISLNKIKTKTENTNKDFISYIC